MMKTGVSKRWASGMAIAALLLAAASGLSGCATRSSLLRTIPEHRRRNPEKMELLVTGYCPCGKCTGWRRNWLLIPVYTSGPLIGQRKRVGMTSSGTLAQPGTIAADTRLFPYGTVMYVPGYGYGRVEDTGGKIVGRHIDVFFRRHSQAEAWGRRKEMVTVWRPD